MAYAMAVSCFARRLLQPAASRRHYYIACCHYDAIAAIFASLRHVLRRCAFHATPPAPVYADTLLPVTGLYALTPIRRQLALPPRLPLPPLMR